MLGAGLSLLQLAVRRLIGLPPAPPTGWQDAGTWNDTNAWSDAA